MGRTCKKPHSLLYDIGILYKTSLRSNDVCEPHKRNMFCAILEDGECNTSILGNYYCRLRAQDGTTIFCIRYLKVREYK